MIEVEFGFLIGWSYDSGSPAVKQGPQAPQFLDPGTEVEICKNIHGTSQPVATLFALTINGIPFNPASQSR